MTDADDPYRFACVASEETATPPATAPHPTFPELLEIAERRRQLALFLGLLVGSCLVAAAVFLSAPRIQANPPLPYQPYSLFEFPVFAAALFAAIVATIGIYFAGAKLNRLLFRFGVVETIPLLVPGWNVLSAALLIREAREVLEARGVLVGLFVYDFSQARPD